MRRPRLVEVESVFGYLYAFEGDVITHHIRKHGAHARTDLAFLLSVVEPGDSVFDLGAHVGTFTIPLARRVGSGGHVLAVEGSPLACRVLTANVERFQLEDRCTVLEAVVAASRDRYRLVQRHANTGASYFKRSRRGRRGVIARLPADLVADHFVPRMIKLDIEGFEHSVLEATPLESLGYPILFTEVSAKWIERAGGSVSGLDYMLRDNGYRLFHNPAPSNAPTDAFDVLELATLTAGLEGRQQLNVMAIHRGDDRLARVDARVG